MGETGTFALRIVESVRRCSGFQLPPAGPVAFRRTFDLLPGCADVELFPGIRVRLDFSDVIQRTLYWTGIRYEWPCLHVIRGWLRRKVTHFFDIGSHLGFYTLGSRSSGSRVQVHAFEPNPTNWARLDAAIRDNRLRNVFAHRLALGDAAGSATLHIPVGNTGRASLLEVPATRSERVQVQTFDAWCEQVGLGLPDTPSWIAKIDVEGSERNVLKGMARALRHHAFAGLMVEVQPLTLRRSGTRPADLVQELARHGYRRKPVPRLIRGSRQHRNEVFVPVLPG